MTCWRERDERRSKFLSAATSNPLSLESHAASAVARPELRLKSRQWRSVNSRAHAHRDASYSWWTLKKEVNIEWTHFCLHLDSKYKLWPFNLKGVLCVHVIILQIIEQRRSVLPSFSKYPKSIKALKWSPGIWQLIKRLRSQIWCARHVLY